MLYYNDCIIYGIDRELMHWLYSVDVKMREFILFVSMCVLFLIGVGCIFLGGMYAQEHQQEINSVCGCEK